MLKGIPNIRRVSVSPSCDRAKMAEALQDKYVYSCRPSPDILSSKTFSEEAARKEIRDILEKAHVGVTPGIDFGHGGEGHLRFSYANSLENIAEGLRRLKGYIERR